MTEPLVRPIHQLNAIERMSLVCSFNSDTARDIQALVPEWKKKNFLTEYNAYAKNGEGISFAKGIEEPEKGFVAHQEIFLQKGFFIYKESKYIRWAKTKLDILTTLREILSIYSRKTLKEVLLTYNDAFHISSHSIPPASALLKKNHFLPEFLIDGDLFFSNTTSRTRVSLPSMPEIKVSPSIKVEGPYEDDRFTMETDVYLSFGKSKMTLRKFLDDMENDKGILQAMHDYLKNIFVSVIADDVLAMVGVLTEEEV